jgi:3-hydroxybutyryl-CoA dehydratase
MLEQGKGNMNHYLFSEMHVGKKECIEVQVGEREIDTFAELSGDVSPIHIDDFFAKGRGLKSRIAHGALLMSYVSRLIGTMLPGTNGLLQSVSMEFRRPCYAGTKIKIEGEVTKQVESVHVVRIKILVTDSMTGEILATGQVQSGIEDRGKAGLLKRGF